MFRRLSILVRRNGDDRATFARGWKHHGTLVKHLPGVLSYQQNYVVQEFGHVGPPPGFRVDGVVELRFSSPEAMTQAFASDAAKSVKADEPNFLGHGTGYAMATAQPTRAAEDGSKLIAIIRKQDAHAVDTLDATARALGGCVHVIRDDVVDVIARAEMQEGPQPADAFLHLYFDDVRRAQEAGERLITQHPDRLAYSVFRVRTLTVI